MDVVDSMQKYGKALGVTLRRESPTILTALGVTGLVSTVVLAVKATPQAIKIMDQENAKRFLQIKDVHEASKRWPFLKPMDVVKLTWKLYIPAGVVGGITAGCIIGANSINTRRSAALVGLYSIAETSLREYRDKVEEVVGAKKAIDIQDKIAEDHLKKNPAGKTEIMFTGKGEHLMYDSLSGRYFYSDIETVRRLQNDFNAELLSDMYKTINEFYADLGLPASDLGGNIGWDVDGGMMNIHFSAKVADNGDPCLVMEHLVLPKSL